MRTLKKRAENEKKAQGRPVSFDREELIDQVMNLFWENGFSGLSFNEIAQKTGLTRASLYHSFESKETLLIESLKHYFKMAPVSILYRIEENEPVGPVFYEMFNAACKVYASDKKHRGCLAIKCLNELTGDGSDLNRRLGDFYEQLGILIIKLVRQAVKQKELPPETDPEATGNMILAFLSGCSTFSKNGTSETRLRSMCHVFLRNVGFMPE